MKIATFAKPTNVGLILMKSVSFDNYCRNYKIMTITFKAIILLNLLSFCCSAKKSDLVSPESLIHNIPYQDILNVDIHKDSIATFNGIKRIGDNWVISTNKGIYILDKSLSKIKKSYTFDIKNHVELFDGQDRIVGFESIELIPNTAQSKFLVLIGNGIFFQIDSKTLSIDWLIKFVDRIETATYSEQGDKIAIGTRYNFNIVSGQKKYYSTLYFLDSKSGEFIKHLDEGASILKVCFLKEDNFLSVAYDWSSYDLWLWSIREDKPTLKFNSSKLHYGLEKLTDSTFLTTTTGQIILWQLPIKDGKLLFTGKNENIEKIIYNANYRKYISLITKPGPKGWQSFHLYFFDSDFLNPVFKDLNITIAKSQFDFDESLMYFACQFPRDGMASGIYSYNMDTDAISLLLDQKMLNATKREK
jgi:hypothetical protein